MVKRTPPSPVEVLASISSLLVRLEKIDAKALEELGSALSDLLGAGESEILDLLRLFNPASRDTAC
ncbi:MAG: hypothetical protein ABC536_06535 [Candidatus Methanosuratincola petrocarbonis]